jgi:hypothetical protein
MIRLEQLGARVKAAERGALPSLLLAYPDGCVVLPGDWGLIDSPWQRPLILDSGTIDQVRALGEKIWRQAGTSLSSRRLRTALRWLEEISERCGEPTAEELQSGNEIGFSELTLFDKRRGRKRPAASKEPRSWWTFHGTADERINPFLSSWTWAEKRGAHRVIRFPRGKRPTGVKTGDRIYLLINSRSPGGEPETYIIGSAVAVAYKPLIDDASREMTETDEYISRYPHQLRIERVRFIRGAVGEGVSGYRLMNRLGAKVFESTMKNMQEGNGNVDPHKSIAQKTMVLLAEPGARESERLLGELLVRLGCVTSSEIGPNDD